MQIKFVNYTPTVQQVDDALRAAILADPWMYRAEAEVIRTAEALTKDSTAVEKLDFSISEYQARLDRAARRQAELEELLKTTRTQKGA